MFTDLLENIQHEVVRILARVQVKAEEDVEAVEEQRKKESPLQYRHDAASAVTDDNSKGRGGIPDEPFVRDGRKVGRNEVCPCGSGKKFKQCHGQLS